MLAIRMRRTGRKGHAQFRVIVQDSRFSPSSGRVVAYLGSYDPHAKTAALDKDKIAAYLGNGARPSGRTTKLFKDQGISLPKWVKEAAPKKRTIRHPEKLRRNRPAEEAKPAAAADEQPIEAAAEAPTEEAVTAEEESQESQAEPMESTEPVTEPQPEEPKPAEEPAESSEEPATENSEQP